MKHPELYVVQPDDERPARKDGTCFYCSVAIGGQHKEGCVIRTRTVVCEFKITVVRRVPEDWEPSMVEFHMNESSWCADNLLTELESLTADDRCLCSQVEGSFVREATAEDEERYGVTR